MSDIAAAKLQSAEFVSVLAQDEVALALLDRVAEQRGWWKPGRRWVRTYGRWYVDSAPRATLLYETVEQPQSICTIDLFSEPPAEATESQLIVCEKQLGWLRLTRFPKDDALPGLQQVLGQYGGGQVLRYRPGKRCTVRFGGNHSDPVRFAKVFADARGAQIHAQSLDLWQAVQRHELDFAVAPPHMWEAAAQTLWQGAAPGAPLLQTLLSEDGPRLAQRMGRAAASITQSSLQPLHRLDGLAQWKRTRKYVRQLTQYVPATAALLEPILSKLHDLHAAVDSNRLRPLHGAPHAHQWLDDGHRLSLVDFDGFALGDPELDVATFVTEMCFEDSQRVPVAEINAAFLSAYEEVAGPLDRVLLEGYCQHKRISKALKYAYSIRPDGAERAVAVLADMH